MATIKELMEAHAKIEQELMDAREASVSEIEQEITIFFNVLTEKYGLYEVTGSYEVSFDKYNEDNDFGSEIHSQ